MTGDGRPDSGTGIAPVRRGPRDPDLVALYPYGYSLIVRERERGIPRNTGRDTNEPGFSRPLFEDLAFSYFTHTKYVT
jgi:hypothetical protein